MGELVRTYIHAEPETGTLLIMAHHLVGDGKSILLLIDHILHNLAGKPLPYEPMMVMDEDFLRDRECFPGALSRYLNRVNRKWLQCGSRFTWEDYRKQHHAYWDRYSSDISVESYGEESRFDLGVTNLTRIDIPAGWGRFSVKGIVFVPPRTSYTKQVAGIATYGNRLYISCHGMKEIL